MITRRYEVDNLTGIEINLGRVGENGARTIEFDVRPWIAHYPNGFLVVYVVPPAPQSPYRPGYPKPPAKPAHHDGYIAATEYADGIASWLVTSNDTRTEGKGAVELILYGQNNEILQSTVVKTKISHSLSHSGHNCHCGPNPNQPWVDQMAHLAMAAQDAAERAEIAAEDIESVVIENTIPSGGSKNQVLAKLSDKDRDIGWMDLPEYDAGNTESARCVINAPTLNDFPEIGSEEAIYKAQDEQKLYQWNPKTGEYEPLSSASGSGEISYSAIHGGNAYGSTDGTPESEWTEMFAGNSSIAGGGAVMTD